MERSKINKIEKIVNLFLEDYYGDLNVNSLVTLPKNKLNEDGNWVHESYCVFLTIKRQDNLREYKNIENMLESILGFEFCVEFI